MKSEWQNKKLDDVCLFLNGLWKGVIEPLVQVGVIRNTNFTKDGSLDYSDIAYLDVEEKKFAKRKLEYGDIILEKSGGGPKQAVGRVVVFDRKEGDFSFSNFTSAIRVINKDELDFKFLHKFLYWTYVSGVTEKIQSNSTGIRNLDGNAYKAIQVQYPVLSEQQRIVAIIDKAFEGIAKARANAEQNLQNARALFESHLQSVFTQRGERWIVKPLSEVCEIKPPKNEAKRLLKNSDFVSFAPMEDLGINQKYLNPKKQRTLEDVAGSYTYFAEGDVLLAKITPCFENGKLGIAQNLKNGIGFGSSEYIVFRPNEELSNEFLYYFLSRKRFIEEGMVRMSGAVGHKRVSKEFIENYIIAFPLIDIQKKMVRKIDDLSKETQRLEALYQRKIELLDELKKSLLQQAFAGEL